MSCREILSRRTDVFRGGCCELEKIIIESLVAGSFLLFRFYLFRRGSLEATDFRFEGDLRGRQKEEGAERQQDGSCRHRGRCFSFGTSLYRTNALVKDPSLDANMMGKDYKRNYKIIERDL